jgi:hypothetical protein
MREGWEKRRYSGGKESEIWHEFYGSVSLGPYHDWNDNEIPNTAGKWWGWPLMASDCEADRNAGLWPMGPFDSAEEAMKALEKFDRRD